jgi:hypothetical protein
MEAGPCLAVWHQHQVVGVQLRVGQQATARPCLLGGRHSAARLATPHRIGYKNIPRVTSPAGEVPDTCLYVTAAATSAVRSASFGACIAGFACWLGP